MAEHFYQYFTSIGKNLQKSIPPTKRQFSDYLKDSNQNSFFIQPITAEEVKDIIMTLIGSKSTGPDSIPTILLKQTRHTVSLPMAKLMSKSFEIGIFRDLCKVQKWYLSLKVKQGYFAIIIDRFPYFQILVKSLKN